MKPLTLYAMTDKGLAVAAALLTRHPDVVESVVGSRDPGLRDDAYDRIVELCRSHGVRHADRLAAAAIPATPYAMAVSWRWLIDAARSRLIVLHDSLLPRLRGFNPLVTALINGDTRLGVTALIANDMPDCGDIVGQLHVDVTYPITIRQAIELISPLYVDLAVSVAGRIDCGLPLETVAQDASRATHSLWRDESDYSIDWTLDAKVISRFIDAVGPPYRGASTVFEGRVVRVLEAQSIPDLSIENRSAGKVFELRSGCPVVVCGSGMLLLTRVVDEASGDSLLPVGKLRVRFGVSPSTSITVGHTH